MIIISQNREVVTTTESGNISADGNRIYWTSLNDPNYYVILGTYARELQAKHALGLLINDCVANKTVHEITTIVDGECINWRAKPRHGLRPVQTYSQADDGKVEAQLGWFHEFVLMPDYSCYNYLDICTYTFSKHCAVVEYEDGTVGYIPSDYIKFIDIGGTENDC